jgi:hypothetical protein
VGKKCAILLARLLCRRSLLNVGRRYQTSGDTPVRCKSVYGYSCRLPFVNYFTVGRLLHLKQRFVILKTRKWYICVYYICLCVLHLLVFLVVCRVRSSL